MGKDYETPLVFRWVDDKYHREVKKCWNCGNQFFVQKSVNEPFICTKCGKEN